MKSYDRASFSISAFLFFRYLQDGTVLAKYAHCFAILMRLRQLCLHPELCAKECESLQHAQNLLQGNWGSVHITQLYFNLWLGLLFTLILHENGSFREHFSNWKNLKTPAFRFGVDGKHFANRDFRQRASFLQTQIYSNVVWKEMAFAFLPSICDEFNLPSFLQTQIIVM